MRSNLEIDVSIIVPFFNEQELVEEFLFVLNENLNQLGRSFEIIAVNDGSGDHTQQIIFECTKRMSSLVSLNLSKNWGQANAIRAGLSLSKGDLTVVMDGDFQDSPAFIKHILQNLEQNQIVVVEREYRPVSTAYNLLHKFYHFLSKQVSGKSRNAKLGNFSGFTREVREEILKMEEKNFILPDALTWLSSSIKILSYEVEQRRAGQSSYGFKDRLKIGINLLFDNTARFLNLVVLFGFCLMLLSLVLLFALFILYLGGHRFYSGWLSLMSIFLITSGFNFFLLGTLGIYMGKIYDETKKRQNYLISQIFRGDSDALSH